MTFRNLKLSSGNVSVATLHPPEEAHIKVVDYSANRLHELGGIPPSKMVAYNGQTTVAVIDTETTCENGDNFGKPLIYDIGVTFVLKDTGEPVGRACFIVSDVFCNSALMKGAFFTNRVFTDYPYILNNGIGNLCTYEQALGHMTALFAKFNTKYFAAYNSAFDTNAFVKTAEYLERELAKDYNFGLVADLNNGTIDVLDLWASSCMTFMSHDDYKKMAHDRNWQTKTHNFITSAEAANNYIHKGEVGEDHTALSDSAIESGIYKYILGLPDGKTVMFDHCLNGHGETWSYVNNLGRESYIKWYMSNN